MSAMRLRAVASATLVAALAALAALPGTASARHTLCDNESTLPGGQELAVDAGPGAALVGVDVGGLRGVDDDNFVCVAAVGGVNAWVQLDPGVIAEGCALDLAPPGCEVPQRVRLGDRDAPNVLDVYVQGVTPAPVAVVREGQCVAALLTTC